MLARRLAGMTIDQAAAAAGVTPSSWANWEAGRRPQRETDVIGAIADALDIDFNWLLFGGPLLSARGRLTKRAGEDTLTYHLAPAVPPRSSTRPTAHRPKVRTDQHRPISPPVSGRRAARVSPVRQAEATYAA